MPKDTNPKSPKRKETPKRFRKAKADATASAFQSKLEKMFDLPAGCIKLVYPSGRKVRTDSTIGAVRAHWAKSA